MGMLPTSTPFGYHAGHNTSQKIPGREINTRLMPKLQALYDKQRTMRYVILCINCIILISSRHTKTSGSHACVTLHFMLTLALQGRCLHDCRRVFGCSTLPPLLNTENLAAVERRRVLAMIAAATAAVLPVSRGSAAEESTSS